MVGTDNETDVTTQRARWWEHGWFMVALVVAGGLLGSSLIGIFATDGPTLVGVHVLSLIGFLISGVLGAWLLLGVVRSGRL